MTEDFPAALYWNEKRVLNNTPFQTVIKAWDKVAHEEEARVRVIDNVLRCTRHKYSVQAWLQLALEPQKPQPDRKTVEIYLNFFSKLNRKHDDDARLYLNNERRQRHLGEFLDCSQRLPPRQPFQRPVSALKFKKNTTNLIVTTNPHGATGSRERNQPLSVSTKLQPTTKSLGITVQFDDLGLPIENPVGTSDMERDTAIMVQETIVFAKIEPETETLPSQNSEEPCEEKSPFRKAQDDFSVNASRSGNPEVVLGSKRKEVEQDQRFALLVRQSHSPVACIKQTLVDQLSADEPGRNAKRRKVDHSPVIISLPSNSNSHSNKISSTPHGKPEDRTRRSITIASVKKSNKSSRRSKEKKGHARCSHPEMCLETHLLQDSGILDVCCIPSPEHNDLEIPDVAHPAIMESGGRPQPQSVTFGGELDSKPEPSRELTYNNVSSHSNFTNDSDIPPSKLELLKLPPIWAESRQEVCEAFDWFRSYQGGVYFSDNTVKGYLLSAFASKHDIFENSGRLIVSHGGGKSESVGCQKGLFVSHQASDQLADDKSVRALLDNYCTGRPLVLLVDDKYALFPYDLSSKGVAYAVLGFYSIVYAWAEFHPAKNKVGRVIRYKFAFRWCEEQGTPWWLSANDSHSNSRELDNIKNNKDRVPQIVTEDDFPQKSLRVLDPQIVCPFCNSSSLQVYSIWVCLMTNCKMFWRNPATKEFLPDDLTYDVKLFGLLPHLPLPPGMNLMPETTLTRAMNGESTSYAFTRGIHCPRCGRLSSRFQFEQLECRACKWTKKADIDTRSAMDLWCDRLPIGFEYFQMSSVSDFVLEPNHDFKHEDGRGFIQTFILPCNRGYIHHIRTPSAAGMLQADEIFKHYQEEAKSGKLKFRRWPLRNHKCRGTLLTNYFSHNAGVPYHYVGGDENTVPFEQVPAVIKARKLIQDRIQQALGRTSTFNEVLSCAYMERQKMAFHSDAEDGLGPLVAGLSLGSPALMHFRLVARHDPLYERRGILLTVVLRHGDILVMDGQGVQEYYEHTVVPNNFRIAATARQITPNKPTESIGPLSGTVKAEDGISEHGVFPVHVRGD